MQATSPLCNDSDVVNLVFSFTVRRNPFSFSNGLVWEQSASNNQIIKGAKFNEESFILILFSGVVCSHDVITVCVVDANFFVQSPKKLFMSVFGTLLMADWSCS